MKCSEYYDDEVKNLRPNRGYTIPEICRKTGWSRSRIYAMMAEGSLLYDMIGCHRRVKGLALKNAYFNH